MVTEMEMFESPDLTQLDLCLWSWMSSGVYKGNVDTPDELPDSILDAAGCTKKSEDQL